MVPQDVFELTGVSDPRLSPDGRTIAYVVGTVDREANEYRGAIWLTPTDGAAEPRRFTSGVKHDADPRWSPDGSRLAFTSNREGEVTQLYVIPLAGGEPRKLTSLKEDVSAAGVVARRLDHRLRRAGPSRRLRGEGRQAPASAAVHAPAVQGRQRRLDRRPPSAPVHRGSRRQRRARRSSPTATSRMRPRVVPGRHDARVRLEPRARLGHRTGQRRVPRRCRGGRAAAAHARRRQLRRDLLVVRRLLTWRRSGTPACSTTPGTRRSPRSTATSGDLELLTTALDRNCGTYPQLREPLWMTAIVVFARRGSRQHPAVPGGGGRLPGARARRRRRARRDRVRRRRGTPRLRRRRGHASRRAVRGRGDAGADRRAAPDAGRRGVRRRPRARRRRALHGDVGRRLRGGRLDHEARRLGARQEVPDAAQHPRRAVRPVRQRLLRRVPGVLRRGLRRRVLQPARFVRRQRGVGAGDPRPRRGRSRLGLGGLRGLHGRRSRRPCAASTSSTASVWA